jgi:pSer/pThr/pTyr-binding forkhead associated (FHA) protein
MTNLRAQLTMTAGPVPGSIYYLEKAEVYLGRDLANDIPIPDAEISRRHARLFIQGNLVFIEDLGSTNGTFVNGARISSPKEIHPGDRITLAEKTAFSFSIAGQGETPKSESVVSYATQPQQVPQYQESYQPISAPVPERELAPAPEFTKPAKKPHGCVIFLLIFLVILVIAALVLVFMPSSWWCAISFNGIPGCPVQ